MEVFFVIIIICCIIGWLFTELAWNETPVTTIPANKHEISSNSLNWNLLQFEVETLGFEVIAEIMRTDFRKDNMSHWMDVIFFQRAVNRIYFKDLTASQLEDAYNYCLNHRTIEK